MTMRSLSVRQRKFVEAYAKSGNITKAAIVAGYAATTADAKGKALLSTPAVAQYMKELAQATKSETIADLNELREGWTKIFRGNDNAFDAKDRLKASELLGKTLGAFIDRQEGNLATVNVTLNLAGPVPGKKQPVVRD